MRDRYRFLGRAADGHTRTPIRAEIPGAQVVDGVAVLRLYDPIDSWGEFWGVSAREFATALDELPEDTTEIQLHINSPGGEVFEGIAILNLLRAHPARVVVTIDGLAASAASLIAMAGDEIVMARNTEMMTHNAWGICVGDSDDMLAAAANLARTNGNVASAYADRAGGTVEDWLALMAAETWFTDTEAVAAGLADRVLAKDPDDAAQAKNRFDLTVFAHAGRAHAPTPAMPARASQTPAAPRGGPTPPKEGSAAVSFTDDQLTTMRQQLGVAADADEATILAALTESLAERADTPDSPAAALPDGVVAIDAAVLAEMRSDAAAGVQARAQQVTENRQRLVASAVNDGRIRSADRDAWLNKLATDPTGEAALASLAPGLVPMDPKGFVGSDDTPADIRSTPVYANWSR